MQWLATSYSGQTVTVTDQAGKKRKSVTDGLGRLKEVYEDPTALNHLTSYSYDVLDNLTTGIGFSVADGLRQKFTQYERDNETGLDYAQARYYAAVQGRFTSPDPFMGSGKTAVPHAV